MRQPRPLIAFCLCVLIVIGVLLSALTLSACQKKEAQAPTPTVTMTPKPTFTSPPPTATATKVAPTNTPRPSVTPKPPTATPTEIPPTATDTPEPTETTLPSPTLEPTEEPTAVPEEELPADVPPPAAASAGDVAAMSKGSPLTYEPQFPPVSPASGPPGHDAYTNPLSGLHVDDPTLIQRRPILVRYGNDRAARPHSGVSEAEIVIEDVMDAWWITRLTAVYLQNEPAQAGPLRSARPVNVEILQAYNGVLVFSGASIGVNQLLAQGTYDLIHEELEADMLYRSSARPAPHNLYTSVAAVRQRIRERGKEYAVDLNGLAFSETPPAGQPVSRIDIPYPRTATVAWTWDAGAGVYRRWVQGDAYADLNTGQQVGAQNVVVLYARHWESNIVEDSLGSTSIGIALKGGERVRIFRDGQMIEGYWWRSEAGRIFQFIDTNGNHIPLKPGHTWIQLVPTSYNLGLQ